jgi:hypothetical protein
MNEKVVTAYLAKLEASLGDDDAFMRVFDTLRADPEVRQVEAVGLAGRFVSPMAASTSKAKAFERILRRHQNIISFDRKQRAVRGRSAA